MRDPKPSDTELKKGCSLKALIGHLPDSLGGPPKALIGHLPGSLGGPPKALIGHLPDSLGGPPKARRALNSWRRESAVLFQPTLTTSGGSGGPGASGTLGGVFLSTSCAGSKPIAAAMR